MEPKKKTGNYGPKCFEARVKGMKNNSQLWGKIPTMGQKMTLLPLFSLLFSLFSSLFSFLFPLSSFPFCFNSSLFFFSSLLFTLCFCLFPFYSCSCLFPPLLLLTSLFPLFLFPLSIHILLPRASNF